MNPAEDHIRNIGKIPHKFLNGVVQFLIRITPPSWRKYVYWACAIVSVVWLLREPITSVYSFVVRSNDNNNSALFVNQANENNQVLSIKNINEAKVMQAIEDRCNTTNNFERSLWKTRSMRVISWDADTGEPDLYGAKQEEPYQSLMVYEIPCQLPLVATVSATIHSPSSIGMVFEFDGVLQVILGDGDLRSIRYKTDTLGSRKMGWRYVSDPTKKVPLTHWLPDGEKITVGTQVDWTTSFHLSEEKIEAQVSLSYKSRSGQYKTHIFPWVQISVQSYNPVQNVGRFIRIGINDQLYKGTQSAIRFRHFSIRSGWSE